MKQMKQWNPSYFQIVVVDDEKNICRTIQMVLEGEGYRVLTTHSGEEAIELVQQEVIDLILLDVNLPQMSGLDVLQTIKSKVEPETHQLSSKTKLEQEVKIDSSIEVVMISGHGTIDDAVFAVQQGAYSFLEKPIDRERLLLAVRQCLENRILVRQMRELQAKHAEQYEMIGETESMQSIFQQIQKVAPTKGWVLITGESGTGKELVAHAIHMNSPRVHRPFVKVNCAAIPDELIESELFGHEKGAFTGAIRTRQGEFERAHGGTIFLDEIGDMSLHAQAKVLRVLNTGELSRVGGDRSFNVDVRVIAATNRQLEKEIQKETFREDLYFRLNVIPIHLPPLRERRGDIPLLLEKFVQMYCSEYGHSLKMITKQAHRLLSQYAWPGNIRELKNLVERLVILSGETIDVEDLPSHLQEKRAVIDIRSLGDRTLKEVREEIERSYILIKLKENQWNISKTSDVLGIERTNLHKKMKGYGIQRPAHNKTEE